MTLNEFKEIAESIQAIATAVAVVFGGLWAFQRFRREREAHPHIEFTCDIVFVNEHADCWIVELLSHIENKGKVQHRFSTFEFDLLGMTADDSLELAGEFGNQVRFPHAIADGSWLPANMNCFLLEPGVKGKYSYITRIPKRFTNVLLHSWFHYVDGRHHHTAERTVACPGVQSATRSISSS